ncbi:MAG TPA: MFS transporter [Candidatus Sulfotelmatobacter sp.]|nr:MFS transporter [Candidatus Sulfotelmatobacter sp.]
MIAWAALLSAMLGWMFDSMDLNIFTLILFPSVSQLIGSTKPADIAHISGIIAGVKLFAWGVGGIFFGVVADRVGRSRTMVITVLIYSIFTGLSGLAGNWWELAILQALASIGIGGEWAAGAALVAETWPERTRARALQVMQLTFAFGFFLAALVNLYIGPIGWRWVLVAGTAPAIITLVIRQFVPEPERWQQARDLRRQAGVAGRADSAMATFMAIFSPAIRRRTIVGVLIATTMMVGSFSTINLVPIWFHQLLPPDQAKLALKKISESFMIMNVGAVLGYLLLIWLTSAIGRRWSYFLIALGSALSIIYTFTQVRTVDGLEAASLVLGFFLVGGYGTFAAYLPELFPTRFRTTGQGFCWNMSRVIAGAGPLVTGMLVGSLGSLQAAAISIIWVYLIGLVAIWFGPETKGVPLED